MESILDRVNALMLSKDEGDWFLGLRLMAQNITEVGPTRFVCSLVQMGVEDPRTPSDSLSEEPWAQVIKDSILRYRPSLKDRPETLELLWKRKVQRRWNTLVRLTFCNESGLRQQLRRVLLDDIKKGNAKDRAPECPGGPWGNIVSLEYARQLLDHFLNRSPDWV